MQFLIPAGGGSPGDDVEELLQRGELQVRIVFLFSADGRHGGIGVIVPRAENRSLVQAPKLHQACVHVFGIASGQIDPSAAVDEKRVSGDKPVFQQKAL